MLAVTHHRVGTLHSPKASLLSVTAKACVDYKQVTITQMSTDLVGPLSIDACPPPSKPAEQSRQAQSRHDAQEPSPRKAWPCRHLLVDRLSDHLLASNPIAMM